jgi:hypothetical protein
MLILAGISASGVFVLKWYNNKLTVAYNLGQDEVINTQNTEILLDYEIQIEDHIQEKAALQTKLNTTYIELDKLKKQLLIEHDLDRLLQRKPVLILNRVNAGTVGVYTELEELTNE